MSVQTLDFAKIKESLEQLKIAMQARTQAIEAGRRMKQALENCERAFREDLEDEDCKTRILTLEDRSRRP